MNKWVSIERIDSISNSLEKCKDEVSPSFYSGARCILKLIYNEVEQTEPQTDCADTNLSEKPTDSTSSILEQVDTDINVRSKAVYDKWGNVFDARADIDDEPQTEREGE